MTGEILIEDMTMEEILQETDDRIVWINAFNCIRPSDEFKKEIGEMVIRNLNRSNLRTKMGSTVVFLKIIKS